MYYAGNLRRPRARAPRLFGSASVLLSACIACFACAVALAQSGRTPPPPPAQPTPTPGDSRPRQVNNGRRELPPAFIVVTAPPDGSQENSPFVPSGYPPTTDFEEIARGASLVALRNLNGVKRVVGDAEVPRWEARETALGEDEAWVVWLELRWQQNVTRDAAPFKLRYLLFEPRTGRLVSSGYGRGVRQTWGRPTPRTSIEDQLRNAGRDIADQVVSELTKAP
ncbi:MAG TPA: hypothetical protein VJ866_09440 [Pyrinomonadaceae bacterium]|nr:hypothetical protein [Pyrinomonadaceae bacterium]